MLPLDAGLEFRVVPPTRLHDGRTLALNVLHAIPKVDSGLLKTRWPKHSGQPPRGSAGMMRGARMARWESELCDEVPNPDFQFAMPSPIPSNSAKPLSDAELDAFDALLRSPNFPAGTMGLEALDGFMVALAAGPELPARDEYLRRVFGGELPAFESAGQSATFERYFQRHWSAVASCLAVSRRDRGEENMYLPLVVPVDTPPGPVPASVFEADAKRAVGASATEQDDEPNLSFEPREGDWTGQHWAWGFMEVLHTWPEAWAPLWEAELAEELLAPVIALELGYFADAPEEKVDYMLLVGQAATSCHGIRDFWRARDSGGNDGRPLRKAILPGRNDACPCGSGRKYKKCHGVSAPQ